MKFIYLILLCGIVYSGGLQAQTSRQFSSEIQQQTCPQGYEVVNCTGNGELTFPNGERYVGQLSRGTPEGSGTFTLESGLKFVGVFRRGVGITGSLFAPNGTPTDAEEWPGSMFVRIPKQAISKIGSSTTLAQNHQQLKIHPADALAVQPFKAQSNLPPCPSSGFFHNCFGTSTSPNGDKYVGEFKDDNFNGQGTATFASGNIYVGEWKDGKRNGKGTFTFANGSKYFGEFKDGNRNGQGTFTFANGNKYVGEWKDGNRNGQGTDTFANGNKYVGEYKNDKRNGQGIEYASNGSITNQGIWADGNFVRTAPVQQATAPNNEIEKLRLEAEESKRKLTELENQRLRAQADDAQRRLSEIEEQLKIAKQQNQVPSSSAMTTMANRKALVIGNDTYKSITKLLNAREDAKAIAANLTAVGYKVTLQLDLNEKEMKTALRTFSSQVQGGDEVMFFFAGHGVQLGAANYLLPTDIGSESEAQVKDEAIQLQRILDDMTEKKAKFTLAMIDACRDNPFKSAGRNIGGRGLAPTTAATGQMVVFSAGTGQQALDRLGNTDKNKNGVFTRTFLKEMQKPGVSIDRIVKNVRNEVAELAKTVGHEQVPAIYDQVLGDFYFKK